VSSTFARAQQLHASGELEAALRLYEEVLRESPADWRALTRLGLLRIQQKGFEEAVALLERAIVSNPQGAEAHAWLGEARRNLGRLEPAVQAFRRALALQPDFAPAWFNLGLALSQSGDPEAAVEAWSRFLELRPGDARATRELAAAAFDLGIAHDRAARLPSAIHWFERAAALAPGRAEIHNALAVALHNFAQHDRALAEYRKALEADPGHAQIHSNLLMALHYADPEDCAGMFREHLAWAARHAAQIEPAPKASFGNSRDPERRLRVGYVSPRLAAGPVAHNLLPLLRSHDRSRFHLTCYATSAAEDAVTQEIRSHVDAWREAWSLDDQALVELVRADAIDIFVDLSGHCPGHRLGVFARRAAPVQLTWLDYSNTTGLATIDCFVGDFLQTPEGTPQRYTEELVRLPDVRLCYHPPDGLPSVAPPPVLARGHVTFGCINRLSKLNAAVCETWGEILSQVPGSRLVLKGTAYASEEVRAAVRARFATQGIEGDRLDLRGPSPELEMLAEYGDIDIALDPFPYNGSTTTCDALTMGVPVVTLAGQSIVARAGLMFLTACGLAEWVAQDRAGYARIACEAACDPARLAALRSTLRQRLLASPVCDGPRFARAFEAMLRDAWKKFAGP